MTIINSGQFEEKTYVSLRFMSVPGGQICVMLPKKQHNLSKSSCESFFAFLIALGLFLLHIFAPKGKNPSSPC